MRVQPLLDFLDLRSVIRASRFCVGKHVRIRGVPAILAGSATIVLAAGVARSLERAATIVPKTLRETRELWLAVRGDQPRLPF